jgi:outer membrane protein OmpA-like peptidoglycan-associated protein
VLDNCTFETGKATLQPEAFVVLDELVAYLNRKDDQRIEIGGHTDNVGKAAANLKLSMERATAVMDYLVAKGISADRLEARGYGMTEPVEENTTAAGRAQNRRTEVKVLE